MRKLIGLVLLVIPFTACGGESETAETPETDAPPVEAQDAETPEGLQIVQVRVEGDAYVFSPASVEAGKPVRLVFDPAGLPGCSRDVTLPDYEITKMIESGDATIEFMPKAKGPIAVACTMNMYRGTLLVE
ncbi:MAG: cupredoxin domain-containing protein [Gemmatimonadota bacterium]